MLGRNDITPMYQQIADFLNKEIIEGKYILGNKIPTEVELIEQFNVSRTTVRLAINQLIEKGLVEKKSGKGTFVKKDKLYHPLKHFKSLNAILLESNIIAETELVGFKRKTASENLCDTLGIPLGSEVLEVMRLYHVNNSRIALAIISIPYNYSNCIELEEARNYPIYQIIEKKFNFKVKQAKLEIFSEKPRAEVIKHLMITEHDPIIGMERISYDENGGSVEHTTVYFLADSYRFTISIPGEINSETTDMNPFHLKVKRG